jgi:hypothetical protein
MKKLTDSEKIWLDKFLKHSPIHKILIAIWWSWFNLPKFERLIEELKTGKNVKSAFANVSCLEIPNNSGN